MTIAVEKRQPYDDSRWNDAILRVNGISRIGVRQDIETQNVILDIEATRDVDYNKLFEVLTSEGLKVVALEASQPSLEEAFVRLTRGTTRS